MREIEFRCWEVAKGDFPGKMHGWEPEFFAYCMYRPDEYVTMQYTGLKDRHEKEIYEGDIVRDCDTSDLEFAMKWDDAKAGYYMPPEFDEEYVYSVAQVKLEIIGNIYENPELLDAKL